MKDPKAKISKKRYEAVPHEVIRGISGLRLSPAAFQVLCYAMSHDDGFVLRVLTIRQALGIGKHVWQRVSQELRDAGCYYIGRYNTPKGVRCTAVFCYGKFVGEDAEDLWRAMQDDTSDVLDENPVTPVSGVSKNTNLISYGFPVGRKTGVTGNLLVSQVLKGENGTLTNRIRELVENCPVRYPGFSGDKLMAAVWNEWGRDVCTLPEFQRVWDNLPASTVSALQEDTFPLE